MSAISRRNFARKFTTLIYDVGAAGLAFYLALNFAIQRGPTLAVLPEPILAAAYALIFMSIGAIVAYAMGMHRGTWRYASLRDIFTILRWATFTILLFLPVVFLWTRADNLPRSVPILAWFIMTGLSIAPRIFTRARGEGMQLRSLLSALLHRKATNAVPVILAGKTSRIEPFIRELLRQEDAPYKVVGILTHETQWHNRRLHGVHILGDTNEFDEALNYLHERNIHPQRLIVADDQIDEDGLSDHLNYANRHGLLLGRLTPLTEFQDGTRHEGGVRSVALGDLLGRPQVVLDTEAMHRLVARKRVLVTGAGGSIGSELVRQIAEFGPAKLIILDNSEFNLYSIDLELSERHAQLLKRDAFCDVRDRAAVDRLFSEEKPEIVFHAAALKHVPLMETHPLEAIRTNLLGTRNVVDASVRHGTTAMVLISTDKAVNPHNVMGATKRFAEAYCQAVDSRGGPTRFVSVRFGNVLGSVGSVIPLFQRQLASGGPLTVTHPDITRYFMTIPEAVRLVLQASANGSEPQAERGAIYVLDMGRPIKIIDIARQMIRLSGKRPEVDVKIEIVGLRPGEKLFEEWVHAKEQHAPTPENGMMVVSPRASDYSILCQQLAEISDAAINFDSERALHLLCTAIPDFNYPVKSTRRQMGRSGRLS